MHKYLIIFILICLPFLSPARPTQAAARIQKISTGNSVVCAIINSEVWCWGNNGFNQLGANNSRSAVPGAIKVVDSNGVSLKGATDIDIQVNHGCAVVRGKLYCWGTNGWEQIQSGGSPEYANAQLILDNNGRPLTGVSKVATGESFTCALKSRQVLCWGLNTSGQLGRGHSDPATDKLPVRTDTNTILTGVQAIDAGTSYACALANGSVYCWGDNEKNQLGTNNGPTDRNTAVPVIGISGDPIANITSLSVASYHACAVDRTPKYVWCWGNNFGGQLANGTSGAGRESGFAIAAQFDGGAPIQGATYLHNSSSSVCAIVAGTPYCWGINYNQIVNGGATNITGAVSLKDASNNPLTNVQVVVHGNNFVCLVQNNTLHCAGINNLGQLGDGTLDDRWTIAPVTYAAQPLLNAKSIVSGRAHSCAIVTKQVYCWGDNTFGQLGNGTNGNYYTGAVRTMIDATTPLTNVTAISAGNNHTCAISQKQAYCWGANLYGQVGNHATAISEPYATPVVNLIDAPLTNVTAIAAGGLHSCAVNNGSVVCWGYNAFGQLGNNTTIDSSTAFLISSSALFTRPKTLTAGTYHTCIQLRAEAKCWGKNDVGQVGTGGTTNQPTAVSVMTQSGAALTTIKSLVAGGNQTCALISTGVTCWGDNSYGQLGLDNADTPQLVPTAMVTALRGIKTLALHTSHTCVLAGGSPYCTGRNQFGQLANNTVNDSTSLIPAVNASLATLRGIKLLSAGSTFTCITERNQILCAGYNTNGELGDDTTDNRSTFSLPVTYHAAPIS